MPRVKPNSPNQLSATQQVHGNERTAAALRAHCHRVWESMRMNMDMFDRLVSSMPRRLEAVIAADGAYTKY